METFCPPLEESGTPVVCYPVANSNLDIVASWEPTQEGEGTPYPAGGGPNLLDMAQCMPTVGKPYGLTLTIDGDIIKASGVPSSEVTEEGQYSFAVASCAQTELRGKGYKVTAFAIKGKISNAWGLRTEDESSLAISAKLTPGVNTDIQFRLMVSKDEPAAYAPYANIRPISGKDSVKVNRCGETLWGKTELITSTYNTDITQYLDLDIINDLPRNVDLYLSGNVSNGAQTFEMSFYSYDMKKRYGTIRSNGRPSDKLTSGEIGHVRLAGGNNDASERVFKNLQITLLAIQPVTYSPYVVFKTTLTLPSTVYGGEVNAVTGEGQETWVILTLDGTEAWGKYGSVTEEAGASCFSLYIDDKDIGFGTSVCNQFANTKNNDPFYNVNMKKFTYTDHPSIKTIYMNYGDDQTVTADTWKAYLASQNAAGTPVQVAYKLATPIHLTATGGGAIKALSGTNTILTDADKATVKGYEDLPHAINEMRQAVVAAAEGV